eukprot:TRINITY_DN17490_c0_g1_i1.p2 TRINITY_DN17490_c0_g1~~TRINITY_DN17490_c0_g1_i1.p2  ORF type:complete len:218 (-),score=87.32 TRINITY_DN17490_c0_g1_i1:289-942(-)
MSKQKINELLDGIGRYDANIMPDLQLYLEEQMKSGTYDLDANLALLKLYLLFPAEADVNVMESVLLKALCAYPATDFSLCLYQIPEKFQSQLKDVIQLAQWLEMAKFTKFWQEANACEKLNPVKDWKVSIRNFIAGVVSHTYRSIQSAPLMELLSCDKGELDKIAKEQGWTRAKDDKETIVVNTAEFESIKLEELQKAQTKMTLEQYRTLFTAASGA